MTNRDVLRLVASLRRRMDALSAPVASIPDVVEWRKALNILTEVSGKLASAETQALRDMSPEEWENWQEEYELAQKMEDKVYV